jgi:hypothetical protein
MACVRLRQQRNKFHPISQSILEELANKLLKSYKCDCAGVNWKQAAMKAPVTEIRKGGPAVQKHAKLRNPHKTQPFSGKESKAGGVLRAPRKIRKPADYAGVAIESGRQTACQRWAKEVFGTNSKGSQSSRRRSRFSSDCLIRFHGKYFSRYLTRDTRRIERAMQGVSGLIR